MNAKIEIVPGDIMDKPRFKISKEEMLDFNDACAVAVSYHDPNYPIDDRDILLGNISAKKLLKHWTKNRVLWENGFCTDLSPDAMATFEEYWEYRKNKKLWKHLVKLSGKKD